MFTSKMTKFLLSSTALSLTVALSVAQAAPEGAAPGTEAREWLHGDPTPDLKAPEFNVEKSQVILTGSFSVEWVTGLALYRWSAKSVMFMAVSLFFQLCCDRI